MSYYSLARSRPLTLVRSQLNPSLFAAASASLFAPPPAAFSRRPPSHRRRHTAALAPPPLAPAPSLPHCITVRRYAPPSTGCTQPRCRRLHTSCATAACHPCARAAPSSPAPAQTLNPAPPCHSLIIVPPPLLLRASPAPHCVACRPYIALAPPRHRLVPPAQNRHRTAFCCLSRWVVTRERVRR
jgi:hypothetical protein